MSAKTALCAALLASLIIPACSSDDSVVDELAVAEDDSAAGEVASGKADGSDPDYTYFLVRRDARKCIYPLCGGFWVARSNHYFTKCADGIYRGECYVADLDFSQLGLNEDRTLVAMDAAGTDGKLVLKGRIKKHIVEGFGNKGLFAPEEAWVAETDGSADGVFVRLTDTGVRCITFPCPATYHEDKLNSVLEADLGGVDFTFSGASEDQISKAYVEMNQPGGVLATGYRSYETGPGGKAKVRLVTKFWRRLQPEAPASDACYVGGCSAQVCSDRPDVITTCDWRPEYACYRDATCERQADGACGWTATPELQACLANP